MFWQNLAHALLYIRCTRGDNNNNKKVLGRCKNNNNNNNKKVQRWCLLGEDLKATRESQIRIKINRLNRVT